MKTIFQQQTTDYSQFEMHELNRTVVDGSGFQPRKDLLASMKKEGFRKTSPIICIMQKSGKLKIAEGHNRFVTARFLGIPVEYLAYPLTEAITPLKYSSSIKAWGGKDFVSAYANEGNADYAEVADFSNRTGIPLLASFSMFFGEVSSSGNCAKKMKSGDFKIKDRNAPRLVAAISKEIGKYCDFSTAISLIHAISKSIYAKGFDADRMMEKINRHPDLIKKCRLTEDYIDMLDLIYNRNTKGEKLYLRVEVEKAMKRRSAILYS